MDDIHLTAALLRAKLKELLENTAKKESVHKCESECGAEQPIYTESQLQQLIKTSLDKAKSWKDSGVLKENDELQIKIENIYYQLQKSSQQVKATQVENTELRTRLLEQSRISEDAKRTAEEYESYITTIQTNFELMKSSFLKLQDQFNQCKIEMGQTQHVLEQSCFTIEGQEQLLDDMRRDIASNRETIANLMAENATKDARSAMLSTQLDSLRLLLANTQESLRMHQGLAKQADLYACQLQLQYDDILGKYTNGQEQLKAQNSKLDEAIRAISEMKIKFVATMEARSAAAEPFPASTSNGKAGQQGVTYHSSGMQSYSSQLRRAAGPGDSIILPSDLETTTRPPEMGPNEGDNGYATKRRDTNHRTSETGIEAPSAGSALEALPAARVAGMAKPSKISALCPGCNEEAFGLMVACQGCGASFHSICARKFNGTSPTLSASGDTTRRRYMSKSSSALLSAYRCPKCIQGGAI